MKHNAPIVGESLTDKVRATLDNLDKFRVDIENSLMYANESHTFDDVVGMVLTGQLNFIPLQRSLLLTEVHTYPRHKNLHTFIAAGDLEELMSYQPKLLELARALDCKHLSLTGRRGWERPLKELGWKLQYITLYKEVN